MPMRYSTLILVVGTLLATLFLLPVEQPALQQLWLLGFLRYVSWPLRILMSIPVFVVALPSVHHWCLRALSRMWTPPAWSVAMAVGLLFFLFRERTLYGDGLRKLGLLSVEELATDIYVWKEPLDSLMVMLTTENFVRVGLGAEEAIGFLSMLAGVVYVGVVVHLSRILLQSRLRRLLFVVGMLALGSSQLWFGHIENYSLVTSATYLTLLLALAHRQGEIPLWMVGLAAGSAVSFHPQAVFAMLPLILLLQRDLWLSQIAQLVISGLVVPVLTIGALLVLGTSLPVFGNGFAGDPQLFWHIHEALHPAQLGQALVNLWLLIPGLPVLLPLARWQGQWQRDWRFRYLALLAAGLLIYHFFFQNDLPRSQDWDLYAIVGPGLMLFLLYVLLREDANRPARTSFLVERFLLPVLTFSLLFTSAWVGVNHHYRLLYPEPDLRSFYVRDRIVDLMEQLPSAQITPDEPICAAPGGDPSGCRRVAPLTFTMPQDGDQRLALFAHAPAQVTFPLRLPPEPTFLWTSIALDPMAWNWGGDGVTFQVWIVQEAEPVLLWERHLSPQQPDDLDWLEVMVPLHAYRGKDVNLQLVTTPGPAGDAAADRAGWGFPWLMRGTVDTRLMP